MSLVNTSRKSIIPQKIVLIFLLIPVSQRGLLISLLFPLLWQAIQLRAISSAIRFAHYLLATSVRSQQAMVLKCIVS